MAVEFTESERIQRVESGLQKVEWGLGRLREGIDLVDQRDVLVRLMSRVHDLEQAASQRQTAFEQLASFARGELGLSAEEERKTQEVQYAQHVDEHRRGLPVALEFAADGSSRVVRERGRWIRAALEAIDFGDTKGLNESERLHRLEGLVGAMAEDLGEALAALRERGAP